ncbi:helix-turn-helix transcriptional regulator [Clostridium sp. UBA1652]|uniref:helix-turn-helix transcriptional regulator n=1 Tax=Clostridium sp. UBA1652 TaxID=1946348 RepID=UPI00257F3DBE|nr:helix-turn-helix transcriptional regulator [Clostridium sp. UBA1652]
MLKIDRDKFLIAIARAEITTTELKAKSNVGRNTISNIINGKVYVRPVIIGKLANALNVSVEDLVVFEN